MELFHLHLHYGHLLRELLPLTLPSQLLSNWWCNIRYRMTSIMNLDKKQLQPDQVWVLIFRHKNGNERNRILHLLRSYRHILVLANLNPNIFLCMLRQHKSNNHRQLLPCHIIYHPILQEQQGLDLRSNLQMGARIYNY